MTKTGCLEILADSSQEIGKVIIHPNDGCDLNLFQFSYPVKIYHSITVDEFKAGGGENIPGEIVLSNDAKVGRVELSLKLCNILKHPNKAVLVYEDGRLFLATA